MTSKNHNNKDITEAEIFQFQCDRTIDRHLCRIDTTDATSRAEWEPSPGYRFLSR
jgi:hypothetical protein